MTNDQWRDERMLEWLESGPSDVPVEPLEAAVAYARTHPRRRWSRAGLRRFVMSQMHLQQVQPSPAPRRWGTALAVAAVVVAVVVVVGGIGLMTGGDWNLPGTGGVSAPSSSPSVEPSASPSPSPSPAALVGDPACVVSTLAGRAGQSGYDDGKGSAARFSSEAYDIAIDASGYLYVADSANHTIRKVTHDGVVTTLAGSPRQPGSADGVGAAARFDRPAGLAIDASGTLYVADSNNDTIRKVAPDGTVTTLAGKAGEFNEVDGVGSAARFTQPASIAVDASGNVYVGSLFSSSVRRIAPDGTVTTLERSLAGNGWDMAMDARGRLWVVDVNTTRDKSWTGPLAPDGTLTALESGNDLINQISDIWIDPAGVVWSTSFLHDVVMRVDPDGTVTVIAGKVEANGSADGTGDVARFDGPLGIVGDASGVLYLIDTGGATIRTITCP